MKFEGGGKKGRKVMVHIEFATFREWVDLEDALEDWPDQVEAFKETWDQQRNNEDQEKKLKKRKSGDVFSCDLNHDDPRSVTLIFCCQETNADYWKDSDHTGPCEGCSKPIVDGKRHVKGENIKPCRSQPIHMCQNHSQGCKRALCSGCFAAKLSASPNRSTPSKKGCRMLRNKKPRTGLLANSFDAEMAGNGKNS